MKSFDVILFPPQMAWCCQYVNKLIFDKCFLLLVLICRGYTFDISIIQVYAPTADSSEDDIELFYEQLDEAKRQCKSQDIIIVMGDLNAKVGSEEIEQVSGKYGLGVINERGERWADWCKANNQVIMNTWFKNHKRRLWTWKHPGDRTRNQIDYVTINHRFRNSVQNAKAYPGADCDSDHNPVVCSHQGSPSQIETCCTRRKTAVELTTRECRNEDPIRCRSTK